MAAAYVPREYHGADNKGKLLSQLLNFEGSGRKKNCPMLGVVSMGLYILSRRDSYGGLVLVKIFKFGETIGYPKHQLIWLILLLIYCQVMPW